MTVSSFIILGYVTDFWECVGAPPFPIYDEPRKRPFCIGLIWDSWAAILESYYHFSNQHFRICQNARFSVKQEKSNNSSNKNA